jgi:hypothetical protein
MDKETLVTSYAQEETCYALRVTGCAFKKKRLGTRDSELGTVFI